MMKTSIAGLALTALLITACSVDDENTDYREAVTTEAETDETADESTEPEDEGGDGDGATEGPGQDRTGGQTAQAEALDVDFELPPADGPPAVITWQTPGETLHVYSEGSSTEGCYPVPTQAWTDGERMEIEFDPADVGRECTADMVAHGWTFTWDEPFEVTEAMPVDLIHLLGADRTLETELPAEPIEPLA